MIQGSVVKMTSHKKSNINKIKLLILDVLILMPAIFFYYLSEFSDKNSSAIKVALGMTFFFSFGYVIFLFLCQLIFGSFLKIIKIEEKKKFYLLLIFALLFSLVIFFSSFHLNLSPQELWKKRGFPNLSTNIVFKKLYRKGGRDDVDIFLLEVTPDDVKTLIQYFHLKESDEIPKIFGTRYALIPENAQGWVNITSDWKVYKTVDSFNNANNIYITLVVNPNYKLAYIIYDH